MNLKYSGKRLTFFSTLLVLVIIPFIIFDAFQQKYYMDTFQLWPEGQPQSILFLFRAHLIRWGIWAICGVGLVLIALKFSFTLQKLTILKIGVYLGTLFGFIILDIFFIDLFYQLNTEIGDFTLFGESFTFFFYQKAPVFFISYIGLLAVVHFYKEKEQLTIQLIELKELKESNKLVYNELKARAFDDSEQLISVKIGNRLKQVSVSDIEWIESDNYCVKLHTGNGPFTLRASMKYFEKLLPKEKFIRVHRNAIVNKSLVDELDLSTSPIVKLRNGEIIKIAQSRVGEVRKRIRSEVA